MKKVLLLCLLFVLSNSLYAQETPAEKAARTTTETAEQQKEAKEKDKTAKTAESNTDNEKDVPTTGTGGGAGAWLKSMGHGAGHPPGATVDGGLSITL